MFSPTPLRGEGWGEGSIWPHCLSRHPCAGRRRFLTAEWLVIQGGIAWLSRGGDLAAYAAGVSPFCRRPSHFSLLAQRKVTQRKGPPDEAPSGPTALQVRGRVPGFSTGLLPRRKGIGIPADSPAGLFSTRPPPHTGPSRSKAQSRRLVQRCCTSHRGRSRCSCSRAQSQGGRQRRCPLVASSPRRSGSVASSFPGLSDREA